MRYTVPVPSDPLKAPLHALAKLYGIETSYVDMKHKPVEAPDESILAMLRALGAPLRDISEAAAALKARRAELPESIEPVCVAWDGQVDLRRFRNAQRGTLILEDGTEARWPAATLPLGYHRLVAGGGQNECLILSAPTKAHFPPVGKTWGVFAPTYALRSDRNFGGGDLSDLEALVSWTSQAGGKVVSTLPLLASFLDKPFEPSPYSPASRLFWNEFFADVEKPFEFGASPKAQQAFKNKPRLSPLLNYRELMQAKRRVLQAMSEEFFSRDSSRTDQFQAFSKAGSELSRYAEFRAVVERRRCGWREWPARLRDGVIERDDRDDGAVRYHVYAQWVMDQQLRLLKQSASQASTAVYLDLPLGIHMEGYDTWRYRSLFLDGISGGAPPDPVFTTGQNWSFPPMNPHTIRRDHYRYVIASIRNHLRFAQLLRIDHVMGLHRLFCIPEGMEGRDGIYLRYPAEELYAILSLESHRHNAGIVGEDLGLVPGIVRRTMKRHDIRGLYILQVEPRFGGGKLHLRRPPAGSVASLNTHDMFPFAAYLDGKDIDDRAKLGFIRSREASLERKVRRRVRNGIAGLVAHKDASRQDLLKGCLGFLAKSKAEIVLVNLEDLWMEEQPQNIPATTKERPNWRRRMRYSMEEFWRSKKMQQILETMKRKV
jgi:4-alpha-glucanotransferase